MKYSLHMIESHYLNCSKPKASQFFIFFLILCFLSSCDKRETESLDKLGLNYYPLSIGRVLTYNLDSIIYDPQPNNTVKIDTTYWQIREVVKDTFRDNSGILQYRIEKSERKRGATNWQITKIVTESVTVDNALRDEDNQRYLKFPLAFIEKMTWNGNIFNNENTKFIIAEETLLPFSKKWTHRIESIAQSEKIGSKTYSDILTVIGQTDPKSLIEKRYLLEKYAKGIGLVYKELHILDTQKIDAAIAWEKKAEKGVIIKMVIND